MVHFPVSRRFIFLVFLLPIILACTPQEDLPEQPTSAGAWRPMLIASQALDEPIRFLAYLTGREQVAVTSDQHLWVLEDPGGKNVYESGFNEEILQLSYICGDNTLAIARRGWGLSLLDAKTGVLNIDLDLPLIGLLVIDPAGSLMAAADTANMVSLRQYPGGALIDTLPEHGGEPISAMSFNANGSGLVTAYQDGVIEVWDVAAGTLSSSLQVDGLINDIAVSVDDRFLAVSHGNNVSVYQLENGLRLAESLDHGAAVMALAFSPDSEWLATGGADHTVRLWQTGDWSAVFSLLHPGENQCSEACGKPEYISALAFSPASDRLFSGNNQGMLFTWQIAPLDE